MAAVCEWVVQSFSKWLSRWIGHISDHNELRPRKIDAAAHIANHPWIGSTFLAVVGRLEAYNGMSIHLWFLDTKSQCKAHKRQFIPLQQLVTREGSCTCNLIHALLVHAARCCFGNPTTTVFHVGGQTIIASTPLSVLNSWSYDKLDSSSLWPDPLDGHQEHRSPSMFEQLLREHKEKQARREKEEEKAQEAAAARVKDALVSSKALFDPDAKQAYQLQRELDSTLRDLVKEASLFHQNVHMWNKMASGIHMRIKEIGDFDQWLHKVEWDLQLITQALERAQAEKNQEARTA